MKKLLFFSLFIVSFFLVSHAHAAINLVASTSTKNGCDAGNTHCSLLNTLNVPAGDTLLVSCNVFVGSATSTVTNVTSTAGDTFTKLGNATNTSNDQASLWYATSSIANASDVVTCTWNNAAGAANSHTVTLRVYSGAGGGFELATSSGSGSSANPWVIPTSTPSNAGEVMVGNFQGQGLGASCTAQSPSVMEAAVPTGNNCDVDYGTGTTLGVAPYSVGVNGGVTPGHWVGIGGFLMPPVVIPPLVSCSTPMVIRTPTIFR